MPHFFLLLFKINMVLLLFAAAYYLILRKLTFYQLNRAFLIFGILFASSYPFINLTAIAGGQEVIPNFVSGLSQNMDTMIRVAETPLIWQVLRIVFFAGVSVMAARLFIQFISLYRIHRKSSPGAIENHQIRILKDRVSPFSFWQTIYINPVLHRPDELSHILEHEKIHVKEWHTIDIILSELSLVAYWFNPGIWLMKKAVKENIEFITDAKIIQKGFDKKAYQYSLLGVGSLQHSVALVNNFNLSDLKKRIVMMNSKRSSKLKLTRYLFALPLLLCVTLAFTIDKKKIEDTISPVKALVTSVITPIKKDTVSVYPEVKKYKAKKMGKKLLSKPADSSKNVSFVLKTDFDIADTSHQAIAAEMKKMIGKVITMKFNTNSDAKVKHYTLKDTLRLDQLSMTLQSDHDRAGTEKKNVVVKKMIFIKTTGNTSPQSSVSFSTDATGAGMDFYVNGQKVEKKDLNTIDPNQIADIRLSRDHNSSVFINTKP